MLLKNWLVRLSLFQLFPNPNPNYFLNWNNGGQVEPSKGSVTIV